MQEYEQHLIGLGVKTGNQQSTRFHSYGKGKKKPRGRGRGAYQQGEYYPVPPLSISCLHSSTHSSREVVFVAATGAGEAVEAGAKALAITKTNNNNPLNNDTLRFLLDLGIKAYLQPLLIKENWSSWNTWSGNALRPPTSSLPFLQSTLNNLRAARDQREKIFGFLASEPDPRTRDQHLQQLLNTTIEDTPQMQFMLEFMQKHSSCVPALTGKVLTHTNQCSTHTARRIPQKRP